VKPQAESRSAAASTEYVTVTDSEPDRLSLVTQSQCPSPGPLAAVAGSLTGAHWHLQAAPVGSLSLSEARAQANLKSWSHRRSRSPRPRPGRDGDRGFRRSQSGHESPTVRDRAGPAAERLTPGPTGRPGRVYPRTAVAAAAAAAAACRPGSTVPAC
jgi:hypothetical protein